MSESDTDDDRTGLDRLPVTVLTGFLGAGKTTLLNALLKHPEMSDTAVVINEFGEIGIDHDLVENAGEDMVVMDSGCLCCTIRGDLIETLRGLIRRRWKGEIPAFNRLLIETTGLADPAPILHTLMTDPVICARYRLDGVATVVDGAVGMATLDAQPEAVKQAAVADRLLLTKTDIADGPTVSALQDRLRALNPAAPILKPNHGDIDPNDLFGSGLYDPATKSPDVARWLAEEAYADGGADGQPLGPGHGHHGHGHDGHGHHGHGHAHDPNRHDDRIHAFTIRAENPLEWDRFVDFIEALTATHGASILRLKGILAVRNAAGPVAVHGVQHVFHPPAMLPRWPEGDPRHSRLVIIAREVSRTAVEKLFRELTRD